MNPFSRETVTNGVAVENCCKNVHICFNQKAFIGETCFKKEKNFNIAVEYSHVGLVYLLNGNLHSFNILINKIQKLKYGQ